MFKHTAYRWIQDLLKSSRARLGIVFACMGVFIVVFPAVYRAAGPPAGALVTVMVLIASLLLGMKGGILVWALTVPIFAIQVSATGQNGIQAAIDNWPGIAATLVLTVVTGYFRNFIAQLWTHHQVHVTVNEERLKKINDCFLSFDIEPEKNIHRLTAVAGEVLGAAYSLYNRWEADGSLTMVDFWSADPDVVPHHDPRCMLCRETVARKTDEVVLIGGLGTSPYAVSSPDIPQYGLETFAGKTVRAGDGLAGILTVKFRTERTLTTAEQEIIGIVASAVAIEEKRLRSERASRESEQSYIALFNSVTESIGILDVRLRFINVNDGATRMFGYSRGELVGKTLQFVAANDRSDPARLAEAMRTVFATGHSASFELWGRRSSGDVFPMYVVCSRGKYFGKDVIIVTALELTEQKRMQEQLLQSQKLESLGTLTGGIAHDFNNLLAMILGSAEMLQRRLPAGSELKKYADRIVDSSKRGTSISRQLLIFSRPDHAELALIELPQLIGELDSMLVHFLPKTISIAVTLDAVRTGIVGDAGQIHQALLNLAINAGDAMKQTGTLSIRTFDAEASEVQRKFGCRAERPFIGISVSDTGVGMDEQTKAKIFDPFFSTKAQGKGTGLGLAIVHGIVKQHHGYIDVESVPGFGTTFTLYIPAADAADRPHMQEPAPAGLARHATVLLVDDEDVLRDTIGEYLAETGCRVYTATNGVEGLHMFEEHRSSIDIVVTDLGMPEMGGEDFYRRLHAIDPGVKVIVASGYLDGTSKEELMRLGVNAVLTKPCRMQDISAAIHAAIGGQAGVRTAPRAQK